MCLRYLQELSLAQPLICQFSHRIFCTINGFHAINNMNGSFWKLLKNEWRKEQIQTIDITFVFSTFLVAGNIIWLEKFDKGKDYFDSQFQRTIHYDGSHGYRNLRQLITITLYPDTWSWEGQIFMFFLILTKSNKASIPWKDIAHIYIECFYFN